MLKIKYSKYSREITSAPPPKLLQAAAPGSWGFAVAEASDASRESQGTAGDNCPDWALFCHLVAEQSEFPGCHATRKS